MNSVLRKYLFQKQVNLHKFTVFHCVFENLQFSLFLILLFYSVVDISWAPIFIIIAFMSQYRIFLANNSHFTIKFIGLFFLSLYKYIGTFIYK